MAIAQVQKASNQPGAATSSTATLGATPTNGNKLIAFYRAQTTSASITPPTGWTIVATGERTGLSGVIAYKDVAGDAAGVTFSTSTSVQQDLSVFEYSGLAAGTADKTANAASTVTGTSQSTGTTATTTQADELAIAGIGLNGGAGGFANTWTNSFTQQAALVRSSWAHRIVSATGTYETTEGWTTTAQSVGVIATFKGTDVRARNATTVLGVQTPSTAAKKATQTARVGIAALVRGTDVKVGIAAAAASVGVAPRSAATKHGVASASLDTAVTSNATTVHRGTAAAILTMGATAAASTTKKVTAVARVVLGVLPDAIASRLAAWFSFEATSEATSLDDATSSTTSLDDMTVR